MTRDDGLAFIICLGDVQHRPASLADVQRGVGARSVMSVVEFGRPFRMQKMVRKGWPAFTLQGKGSLLQSGN